MAKQQLANKVSVDIVEKDRKFFASVDLADSQHSLGPTATKDEIYHLVHSFISDLRLMSEINRSNKQSDFED